MNNDATIAILGAGITGLSIAYALNKQGIGVTIYEKKNRPGGVIQSYHQGGWLVEKGPNTMLIRDQTIWDLLDELQLTNRIIKPGSKTSKRYVVRNGKVVAVPTSLLDFFKTDLLSATAKFRLLKEPFISSPSQDDKNIAGFIRRRLGPEVLDYAVNPFVSGIYGGDPAQLSIKHTFSSLFEMEQKHGSLTKGFLKQRKGKNAAERALISFDDGLRLLPRTIAGELSHSLELNTEVKQISSCPGGWQLCLQSGDKEFDCTHPALVSTIPTHQFPEIWSLKKQSHLIQKLSEIKYAPMSVLALGFGRDQIQHHLDGFGLLIPQKEPFSILGCLFSSSLFNHRAPEDHVLLTCFTGGASKPKLANLPSQKLIAEVLPQLNTLLGVSGNPVFSHHTFWNHAIPQYTVGYDHYLQAMAQIESSHSNLFLAGNYRGGVSVPDCIINGVETAKKVEQYL